LLVGQVRVGIACVDLELLRCVEAPEFPQVALRAASFSEVARVAALGLGDDFGHARHPAR
jgi:hypothetical protein